MTSKATKETDKDVIWLASYPRSGNTWLRILLNGIVAPGEEAKKSIPTFHKAFPEAAPVHNVDGATVKIIKTHCNPHNKRLFAELDRCVGALTVCRHPLDILLSAINYLGLLENSRCFKDGLIKSVDEICRDNEIDYYVDSFIENDGVLAYKDMCGAWSKYQLEWDEYGMTIKYLKLRYEDMVHDPRATVKQLYGFVGRPWTQEAIDTLIAAAEEKTSLNGRFFWRKRAYNYKTMLPASTVRRFCRAYEEELNYLGYSE